MTERIPYEKTKDENSVEILFAKKFETLERHKMERPVSEIMTKIILSDIKEDAEMEEVFLCKVITGRFQALGYTMDIKSKVFLAYITNNPGIAVMYCHYLAYFCKKNGISNLTFDDLCIRAFPFGFPSEEDLHELWDAQKICKTEDGQPGTDNLLDYFHASKSMMPAGNI